MKKSFPFLGMLAIGILFIGLIFSDPFGSRTNNPNSNDNHYVIPPSSSVV